ncbi:hypothetical protein GW7_06970 [Heterocephalus glaber]|uniref:Uncharacterized protein n=1 Tax=Heterocephalus glaber TaxID=10181 RepID=G5B5V7_HETGA|nr:hypothetical protein GW7_06970 [Heterocephalus glaber]
MAGRLLAEDLGAGPGGAICICRGRAARENAPSVPYFLGLLVLAMSLQKHQATLCARCSSDSGYTGRAQAQLAVRSCHVQCPAAGWRQGFGQKAVWSQGGPESPCGVSEEQEGEEPGQKPAPLPPLGLKLSPGFAAHIEGAGPRHVGLRGWLGHIRVPLTPPHPSREEMESAPARDGQQKHGVTGLGRWWVHPSQEGALPRGLQSARSLGAPSAEWGYDTEGTARRGSPDRNSRGTVSVHQPQSSFHGTQWARPGGSWPAEETTGRELQTQREDHVAEGARERRT